MPSKKIVASVISDLTTDQRVIRICTTLAEMGFRVTVIARQFPNSLPLDQYNFDALRIKCYSSRGFLQYAEFNIKLFFRLLFCKTDYFLSNDLDTLLPNFLVSKLKRKQLFYDTHEYFTGVPELKNSPFKRKVWKTVENWLFPKLKVVYTVNDSVKKLYQEEYGNKIEVIRNIPPTFSIEKRELPKEWNNKVILLMQGAGINNGRGGLELAESMKYLDDNYLLVFIGGGNIWDILKKQIREWGLDKKIQMIEKIPPSELKKYTPIAHIGFSLDTFTDLNHLYNLPNKIFDYIHAGVPVIATGIPEVKKIIDEYQCGVCIDKCDPLLIADTIKEIIKNKEEYNKMKSNCLEAAKTLSWDHEKKRLIMIYKPYL